MKLKWPALLLSLAVVPSVHGDQDLLNEIRHKEAEWAKKRVWQPELPASGGKTRPVTCRVVSYGGKWTRHGFGGHAGGACLFRYSNTPAYDPLPGVTDRTERRMKVFSPIRHDVDGDGNARDDFIAALKFSLDEPLSILDWPQSATFPGRYSARFYGGYGWYVSDAEPETTRFVQEIGINADHSCWPDCRAEDHPLNGSANEEIASSGLRFYFVPIWKKEDLLGGGDRYKVTLDEDSFFGSLCTRNYWIGFDDVRYVVIDGGQLYISDNKQYKIRQDNWTEDDPGSIFAFRPSRATWAEYNPQGHIMHFDPQGAKFQKRHFKDVQAVGWYLAKNGLVGKLAHCKWYGAEFKATVHLPEDVKSVHVDMRTIPAAAGAQEFAMSTCEIPYLLWKRVWEWGDACHYSLEQRYLYRNTGDMGSMRYGDKPHGQDEPVTGLNWHDVLAWCNTLSEMEGKTPCYYEDPEFKKVFRNMHQATWYDRLVNPKENKKPQPMIFVKWDADGHRLPTPAEWRTALGSGSEAVTGDSTATVGCGKANSNGLYDMLGNVWELVWTHGDAYDPKGEREIVALGGSFHGGENPARFSASPYGDVPFDGHHAIGFRIVSRDAGLAKPQKGEVKGIPAWTIRHGERLPAKQKANPVGPGQLETVAIPAGSYKNGNRVIKISAMQMGKTEVSFAQWEKVRRWAEANGYGFDTIGDMGSMFFFAHDHSPAEPVVRVRWNDLLVWCNALSEMEDRTPVYYTDEDRTTVYRKSLGLRPPKPDARDLIRPGGSELLGDWISLGRNQKVIYARWDVDGFRLPTVAEMAYVYGQARWGGGAADREQMSEQGWHMLNAGGKTHPVGMKAANRFGLHDLFGNVYEWFWDLPTLKAHTLRNNLYNNNPKSSMFWPWEEADYANYKDELDRRKVDSGQRGNGMGWGAAQASGGSWLWDRVEGHPHRPQMHYADLGFRVVRNDTGTHPRDGRYAWDELPTMLETAGKEFDLSGGKVWRGDNGRSGVYPSPGVRKLKGVKWTRETGGKVTSSPLVVDGRMYVGTVKGVLCLDATDGSVIWEKPIAGGSDSSACLHDGVIYIGGNDAKLHALKADSGETIWTSPATAPLKSSPCVTYGVVFCGLSTGVSVSDGKPVWGQLQRLGPIAQVADGRLSSPSVDTDHYIQAGFSGRFLDIRTGMGSNPTGWAGQNTYPIVDGVVYGINSGMGGASEEPNLLAHSPKKTFWRFSLQPADIKKRLIAVSAPAVWKDYVFVASDYGTLHGLDRRTGEVKWQQELGRELSIRSSVSVSKDGLVYLGTHDHHVYCVDGKTGKILWKHKTGAPVVSSACVADGIVFIGSNDGMIYAFEGHRNGK
jgi:outer membrane protein assembly factor BamB/formylglycine-generating enzyme required for sulfatase activity